MIINYDFYYCKKCQESYHFDTSKEYSKLCPVCNNEMEFQFNADGDTELTEKVKNQKQNDSPSDNSWKMIVLICGLILISLLCIFNGNKNNNKDDKYVCSSCHKTFTNRADTKSIAYTSMCEPCYEDYKFKQELQEEIKKYQERN